MSVTSKPIGSVATSARAGAAPDVLDLVGELLLEERLDLRAVASDSSRLTLGEPDGVDDDRAFVRAGGRTPSRGCSPRMVVADGDRRRRRRASSSGNRRPELEERLEEPVGEAVDERFLVRTSSAAGRGRPGRASASATGPSTPARAKMTVKAIGRNSFPSTPSQGQDRQIDDHDDQFAEHRRLSHLDGGVADDVELLPARCGRGPGAARSSRP